MFKRLKWETDKRPANKEDVKRYEKELHITFPESYKKIAIKYHGGYPDKDVFDSKIEKEKTFSNLLSFDGDKYDDLLFAYRDIKDRLMPGIIPFAVDAFDDYICFKYFDPEKEPTVVFWDHECNHQDKEKAISEIADSFEDFLKLLYLPDDDD